MKSSLWTRSLPTQTPISPSRRSNYTAAKTCPHTGQQQHSWEEKDQELSNSIRSQAMYRYAAKQHAKVRHMKFKIRSDESASQDDNMSISSPDPFSYLKSGILQNETDDKAGGETTREDRLSDDDQQNTEGVKDNNPETDKDKNDSAQNQKQPMKMRIGVADFANKVKDNEGMGISTLTNEEEEISAEKAEYLAKKEVWAKQLELDEKILEQIQAYKESMTMKERLQRVIRTVVYIVIACRTKSEQTRKMNSKYMTFTEMTENDPEQEETRKSQNLRFLFDRDYFKARQEMTLRAEAVEILKTHPNQRTEAMVQSAMSDLSRLVESFSEFPINMQRLLIKRGWFEKFESKRVIIRQGHRALNFYFIISGLTVVSVARQNKVTGETYGETVAMLKKGNSFGELALMYGGKRSATVSCKSSVELLAVSREDFIDIFMNLNTDTEPDHIAFLREIPVLQGFNIESLPYDDPSICLFTYFRRGVVMCRDSNVSEWIYIIKSGTCRILKDVRLNCKSRDGVEHPGKIADSKFFKFMTNLELFSMSRQDNKPEPYIESIPFKKIEKRARTQGRVYINLGIRGPRDTFGLEPIAYAIVGGTTGVTFISDGAECVAISRNFFKDHVDEEFSRKLRTMLQPFPSPKELEAKLNAYYEWDAYRAITLDDTMKWNTMEDTLN